jgi:hypothetical protein
MSEHYVFKPTELAGNWIGSGVNQLHIYVTPTGDSVFGDIDKDTTKGCKNAIIFRGDGDINFQFLRNNKIEMVSVTEEAFREYYNSIIELAYKKFSKEDGE